MFLQVVDRFQEDAINVCKCTETVGVVMAWVGLELRTPPRNKDNEGRNSCWSPKQDVRFSARGRKLRPPLNDLLAKGMNLDTVVLLIVVSILVKLGNYSWAFHQRESRRGLDITSVKIV
jgi:hypothetical protein